MSLTGESLNYYETLRICRDANFAEIKRAFMEVATSCHPSKNPNQAAVNQAKFAEVCEAYDVLSQSKCSSLSLQINSEPAGHL